jgi:tRNA (guanine-N7-)-methyltransferase
MSTPRPYDHAPRLPEGEPLLPEHIFGQGSEPFELEVGPGRGGFLFERLAAEPASRIIGLEIRRKWATVVDERLAARGLGARGRVFAEDASHALPRFATGSVARVFVHFPDPWWKKRHTKRLVLTDPFVRELARVLVPGGELFVQTDVAERAERYAAVIEAVSEFHPGGETARVPENPFQAKSPRERRAEADGLPIYRLLYRRAGGPG